MQRGCDYNYVSRFALSVIRPLGNFKDKIRLSKFGSPKGEVHFSSMHGILTSPKLMYGFIGQYVDGLYQVVMLC